MTWDGSLQKVPVFFFSFSFFFAFFPPCPLEKLWVGGGEVYMYDMYESFNKFRKDSTELWYIFTDSRTCTIQYIHYFTVLYYVLYVHTYTHIQ